VIANDYATGETLHLSSIFAIGIPSPSNDYRKILTVFSLFYQLYKKRTTLYLLFASFKSLNNHFEAKLIASTVTFKGSKRYAFIFLAS